MKKLLLASLLGLASCSAAPEEKRAQATEARTRPPVSPATSNQVTRPSASKVDTVDHFFFTNAYYRRLAGRNQLDMFKLDSAGTLDIVGRDVAKLRYKIGETTTEFLQDNLAATDSLPFEKVSLVAWASDLSGNDEQLFFFKNSRLRQVRKDR